jgi:hypothetical protein
MSKVIFRTDTAIRWTKANPVLARGEPAYERDTGRFKIGDGIRSYTDLPYQRECGRQGSRGEDGAAGPDGANGAPYSLSIGVVTEGKVASATITGVKPDQKLNLVLPPPLE